MERLEGERLTTRLCEPEVDGIVERTPSAWYLDGVRNVPTASLRELINAQVNCMNAERWRGFMNGTNGGVKA